MGTGALVIQYTVIVSIGEDSGNGEGWVCSMHHCVILAKGRGGLVAGGGLCLRYEGEQPQIYY